MTARDVATYVSVFQPGVLPGTSAEYIHLDDYRRFREAFITDDKWRAGRRLSESAEYPVPAPTYESESRLPEGTLGDVYGALLQLGFKPPEFEAMLETMDPRRSAEDLVREALGVSRLV